MPIDTPTQFLRVRPRGTRSYIRVHGSSALADVRALPYAPAYNPLAWLGSYHFLLGFFFWLPPPLHTWKNIGPPPLPTGKKFGPPFGPVKKNLHTWKNIGPPCFAYGEKIWSPPLAPWKKIWCPPPLKVKEHPLPQTMEGAVIRLKSECPGGWQ